MTKSDHSKGQAEGASSLVFNARQLRALSTLVDAFERWGPTEDPAILEIYPEAPGRVRVVVHAAVAAVVTSDTPTDEIACLIDEEGGFYDYDEKSDVIRWLVPVALPQDASSTYPYRGGLLCYRSEGDQS